MPEYTAPRDASDYTASCVVMQDTLAELYNKMNQPKYYCEAYDNRTEGDSLFVGTFLRVL